MALTEIDKSEKRLRKAFHSLARRVGMSDEQRKEMIYDNYGVTSSVDLDAHQLIDLIHTLEKLLPKTNAMDLWRKRLIATIGGYLRESHKEENINVIKAIACRAAGVEEFNKIGLDRLRSLYNAFNQRTKDLKTVNKYGEYAALAKAQDDDDKMYN